ncbi:shikimate dehydrogenase [Parahaliea sp. F7430]|uniref:Shikimate dehydrogenase (NADP(+)) n=1 Tax=Sediminihaliea albiluteola TaxID=2758564 RepID=A0A7W2TXV5_9GAMM|nr:shikimate dehydrogenase [Sediminihaliea albiluteola]MBA6413804.1 shikimate dehydrogenase [Sediminihaliea albiluteola]
MTSIDKYAVFGNPIKHSKSPLIHASFAEQTEQALQYRAVRVELDAFECAVKAFFDRGGRGLNVTVPFKQQAYDLAVQRSVRAERAGAVNTLYLAENGELCGDNTDGIGLVRDMVANLGWSLQGQRMLILGAGGAVRGVLEPLLKERPASLTIVNRTAQRATDLAQEFAELSGDSGLLQGGGYELLEGRQFDLLINASSAGLSGELPDLPGSLLTERSCCYDMIYGAEPTVFMRWAALHAAWAVADGLGMLVEQAAESFYLWRKLRPSTAPVIKHLRQTLTAA